jgi:hypothetical protein
MTLLGVPIIEIVLQLVDQIGDGALEVGQPEVEAEVEPANDVRPVVDRRGLLAIGDGERSRPGIVVVFESDESPTCLLRSGAFLRGSRQGFEYSVT